MEEECVTPHTTEVLYKEIELYETKLRVYPNGDIWRLVNISNQFGKYGEKWKLSDQESKDDTGYMVIRINNKKVKVHRIVGYAYLGLDITNKKEQIDHINRIRNDNRVENLRISDNQKNQFNREVKGYCIRKYKDTIRYQAYISVNGKKRHLGYYDTPEEASARYYEEKAILHII
jgi:hypothetical protein